MVVFGPLKGLNSHSTLAGRQRPQNDPPETKHGPNIALSWHFKIM